MSRRKAPTLATLADNAAGGRRVVLSSGSMDGAFLAALQRLNLCPIGHTDGDSASTWAPGIDTANAESDKEEPSDNRQISEPKPGGK